MGIGVVAEERSFDMQVISDANTVLTVNFTDQDNVAFVCCYLLSIAPERTTPASQSSLIET